MSNAVQIYLDNYDNAYYPGQTIIGRVECFFDKQTSLRGVKVKFHGRAKTHWTEEESYYDHTEKKHKSRQVTYSAEEVYFEAIYNLVTGGDNFSLPTGRHSYPFSYILPVKLPSSFEGAKGDIRYIIKATVDRPWKFDYEAKIAINLVSPLDLNYVPRVGEPTATSEEKTLCCLWCKSGPLTFDMSLPVTGYVPGQEVNIGACVQNLSNISAECVKFELSQHMEYIAHFPHTKSKHRSQTIVTIREGGIGAHGEKSWTSKLIIPTTPKYPNLLPCGIIKISYKLYGTVVLPAPHSNLDVSFPLVVGNIPLSGLNLGLPGPPPSSQVPVSSFDVHPEIDSPISGTTEGFTDVGQLTNHPSAPYPYADAGTNNFSPYPANKAPYPISSAESSNGFSCPPSDKPTGLPYPVNHSTATPFPNAPSIGISGTPYPNAPLPGSLGALYPNAPPPSVSRTPYPIAPPSSLSGNLYSNLPTIPMATAVPYPISNLTLNSLPPSYEEAQLNEKNGK